MGTAATYLQAFGVPGDRARVLVVVAHPDDETVGAGGLLALAAAGGPLDVNVLHVTDGAPRTGGDAAAAGCADWREYAGLRRAELAKAMAAAGFPLERLQGFGHADQCAALHMAELTDRMRRKFLRCAPDVVLTHAYEGGHPDHDAVAFAVHNARELLDRQGRRAPTIVEMPFYHADGGEPVHQRFLPAEGTVERTIRLSPELAATKRRMLDAFASQARTLAPFGADTERFRRARTPPFARPPHDGRLLYEEWGLGITGDRWRLLADEALRTLGLEDARWV